MRLTTLERVVGMLDSAQLEQFPEAPLITLDRALRISIATPEKIARIV